MSIVSFLFAPTFRLFLKERWLVALAGAGLFLNILTWLLLGWYIKPRPVPFFLHYTVYFGIDWLGDWYNVFFYPAFSLVALLVNFYLAYYFYQTQKLLSYFLLVVSIFIGLLVLLQGIFLIIMNT